MYRLKYPTEQSDPPLSPRDTLPTMYDLPSENHEENGVDQFHSFQSELLWLTFCPPNYQSDRIFSACDLNLYYDVHHQNWYKRPDWFGVVGVSRLIDELSLSTFCSYQDVDYQLDQLQLAKRKHLALYPKKRETAFPAVSLFWVFISQSFSIHHPIRLRADWLRNGCNE
jgi:hypothetical protein